MKHKMLIALPLVLFTIALSACGVSDLVSGPTPTPTSTLIRTLTPRPTQTPTQRLAEEAFNTAEECAHQWENTQKSDDLDCTIHYYQEAIDLLDDDDIRRPYYQFRLDRLLWLSGQGEAEVRERILDFIRQNLDNEEAVEFFFREVLPEPQPADIGERFVIYKDEWKAPHFTIAQYGAQLKVSETHVPGSVHEGQSSLQIKWDKKERTWASLVIGFDPRIADADLARAGAMHSLDLDRFSTNDYRLEFAARGGSGVNRWGEQIMRIKLQDQNLIIREPIGNQMVCRIRLTEEWTTYSIPLGEFVPDPWILDPYVDGTQMGFGSRPWLEFDWTRVKQINFDIPYWASGNGTLWLDNVQLVRTDLASSGAKGCVER